MVKERLGAPVGDDKRKGDGPPVQNRPKDVILLRRMLAANGWKLGEGSRVDGPLLKAIGTVQKRAGMKKPDLVVDPGGKAEKALVDAFDKAEAEAAKAAKSGEEMIKCWKFTAFGKEYLVPVKEMEKAEDEWIARAQAVADLFEKRQAFLDKQVKEIEDAEDVRKGFIKAAGNLFIRTVTRTPKYDGRPGALSAGAIKAFRFCIDGRRFDKLEKAYLSANDRLNAYSDSITSWLDEFGGGAKVVGYTALTLSAVGFAGAGIIATKVLVVAGASVVAASVASGGGIAIIQSSSKELGKAAGGQGSSMGVAAKNVLLDGMVGILGGAITGKLPADKVAGAADDIAALLVRRFPQLSAARAGQIAHGWIAGPGSETAKTALAEIANKMGDWAKTGKAPTEKELSDSISKVFLSVFTFGMLKGMDKFMGKWTAEAPKVLSDRVVPKLLEDRLKGPAAKKLLEKLPPGKGEALRKLLDLKMPDDERQKLAREVADKLFETVVQQGADIGLVEMGTKDSLASALKAAREGTANDPAVRKKAEAEIDKALRKRGAKL